MKIVILITMFLASSLVFAEGRKNFTQNALAKCNSIARASSVSVDCNAQKIKSCFCEEFLKESDSICEKTFSGTLAECELIKDDDEFDKCTSKSKASARVMDKFKEQIKKKCLP